MLWIVDKLMNGDPSSKSALLLTFFELVWFSESQRWPEWLNWSRFDYFVGLGVPVGLFKGGELCLDSTQPPKIVILTGLINGPAEVKVSRLDFRPKI
jgi:hypothetical protein